MKQYKRIRSLLLRAAAAATLVIGLAGMSASASAASLKPVPKAPGANPMSRPVASKTESTNKRASLQPNVAWSVNVTASPQILWPTQYSTLTATANADVGPTPYYISIYDETAGNYVAICASGTSCSASVTQPTATVHSYAAYVASYPSGNPPANVQASAYTWIDWQNVNISLQSTNPTVPVGSAATLTSTTSADIGPSPFYAEIYDVTAGTQVAICGFGTTCTANVTQSVAATHKFVAYVAAYGTAYPPTGVQATSNPAFATWANTGYRVSLTGTSASYGQETLTATSNVNVGPTPYYIEIFNEDTGSLVAVCGSGTTCSGTVSLNYGETHFVAFTSSYSSALPPAGTQANSGIFTTSFNPIP